MAKKIIKERMEKGFGEGLTKLEQSTVYGKFCQRLYGKNLSQLNMTPMDQLDQLLKILHLNENSHVLDLACGIGKIAEYISDTTKAKVTGVDFAAPAIQRAQERNKDRTDRINFVVGNMNDLQFEENTFDAIIAIDTVYFVDDLSKLIGTLKKITKSGGQMGIFYDEMIKPEEDKERLKPDNTKLANVLKEHNLDYQTYDYTEAEKEFWNKQLELAEDMKDQFEAAGDMETYKSRIGESTNILKYVKDDRMSRYLYIVRVVK